MVFKKDSLSPLLLVLVSSYSSTDKFSRLFPHLSSSSEPWSEGGKVIGMRKCYEDGKCRDEAMNTKEGREKKLWGALVMVEWGECLLLLILSPLRFLKGNDLLVRL